MFIDTHCHLNDDVLYAHLDEVIQNALAAKVSKMVCIGYDKASSIRAIEIAEKYPYVYATVGFHPTNALEISNEDFLWLESKLTHPKVVGIGEIGLDYYWDKTYIEKQKEVFIRQMDLADKYHLPISVHMRDSDADTLDLLKNRKPWSVLGIMHCYSGSLELSKEFIKCNMMISLAGPVTFKNARVPKEVAEGIDLFHLLIETDAPYLAPHPFRGKENSPSLVSYVAQEIARLRDVSVEDVAKITSDNALRIFYKIKEAV